MLTDGFEEEILFELAAIKNARKHDPDNTRRAIRSLYYAVKETQHYYESVVKRGSRYRAMEDHVSLYWHAATISMRFAKNTRLAEICSNPKADFINAERWISQNQQGNTKDFSNLVAALANAVRLSNRDSWKNPKY